MTIAFIRARADVCRDSVQREFVRMGKCTRLCCLKCKNRRSTGHNPKRSTGDNINVLGSYSFSRTDVFLEL